MVSVITKGLFGFGISPPRSFPSIFPWVTFAWTCPLLSFRFYFQGYPICYRMMRFFVWPSRSYALFFAFLPMQGSKGFYQQKESSFSTSSAPQFQESILQLAVRVILSQPLPYLFYLFIFSSYLIHIHRWASILLNLYDRFNLEKILEFYLIISFSRFFFIADDREVRLSADLLGRSDIEQKVFYSFLTILQFYCEILLDSLYSLLMKSKCFWFLMCSIITVFSQVDFLLRDCFRIVCIYCNRCRWV